MRKIYIALAFSFLTCMAWGQTFEKTFGLSANTKALEYANAGIELANGNYLIGINNNLLCLSSKGDSLWTKSYTGFGDILKIFRDQQGKLMLATTFGRMIMLEVNENNGDTLSSFRPPNQTSNSGYIIYDLKVLPDGDYILLYTNGGGNGATLTRFTPKATTRKWSNDYAGQNLAPRTVLVDDTCLVFAGYKGNTTVNWMFDLYVGKISINNVPIWNRTYIRTNSAYHDRLMGLQKNKQGNYLMAANWTVNNRGCPAIFCLSPKGDSLSTSTWVSHYGDSLGYGYAFSLEPNGTNGFYAAGAMNLNKKDPTNKTKGVSYMSLIEVSDAGIITHATNFNNIGIFESSTGNYDGSSAWGTGCFKTSDGKYLVYGTGNILLPGSSGWLNQSYYKGYVVKSSALSNSINENNPSQTLASIYPNPASHWVNFSGAAGTYEVTLVDMQGRTLIHAKELSLPQPIQVSELPAGLYQIQLVNAEGMKWHTKFVKE